MDLKQKANQREQLLVLLVLVALFIMFFRVFYLPKREATQQNKNQIANLKMEKDSLTKFTQALFEAMQKTQSSPQKTASSIPTKIKVLKGEIPPVTEETAPLLALLTSPQFIQGVTVKSMSDLPPKKENGYQKNNFFINVQGSFPRIIRYLEKIDQVPALMMMDNVALKTIDTRGTEVDLELNGTLFQWENKNASAKE